MLESVKEIILDFQEVKLQSGVPRRVTITPVTGKATVCIGVRRSGKSTYLFQIIQQLLAENVSCQNIVYLNFFDDRLHGLQHSGLSIILEAYYSLFPEKKNKEKVYFFFDEIQMIPSWEAFVDRLMRTEISEVFITGSSAQMLSREIATQMRGRAISWEMFPFSFHEYLDYKAIEISTGLSTKTRLLVQQAFDDYWLSGGFPEVAGLSEHLRIKIHQEYFNSMLFRDLIERHDISHPKAIIDLAHYLVDNIASLYSLNKLVGYLKSLGHKTSKTTVSSFLNWFEDAYVLFSVSIYDDSLKRRQANPRKIYCIDHALVTSVSAGILINSGHLLENLVFITLRRLSGIIYYVKTQTGKEVDFVIKTPDKSTLLFQACESLTDPQTRKRECEALNEAMLEFKLSKGYIITRHEKEMIQCAAGVIEVLPCWQFMLNLHTL